jgi:DNA-binding NarL/FixJ family response regulator
MSIRVLLVDDQQLVRTGFRMILADEEGIEVVGEAANGREAVAMAAELYPDVIVMDLRMPEMDGLEATRLLAGEGGDAGSHILILTTFDADEGVVEALRAGASGFLLKDVPPADFVQAIRIIASGEALLAPSVTRRLLGRFAQLSLPADETHAQRIGELTEREHEVLELVAAGLSNREIAERLTLAEPTVKTHVSHMLIKLDLRDRTQLVVLAYEAGLVRPGGGAAQQTGRSIDG